MADEVARKDDNSVNTGIGVADAKDTKTEKKEEIRKIRVTDKGAVKVDTGASLTGIGSDALKVIDENSRLLNEMIIQQKITNVILNEVHDLEVNELDIK